MGKVRNSDQVPHRPGPLVQSNKKHKAGKHRTKGAIDKESRGRTSSTSTFGKTGKKHVKRAERKKQALANRMQKINEILVKKKSQGGSRGAPIAITIVPLTSTSNVNVVLSHIVKQAQSFSQLIGTTSTSAHLKLSNGKNLMLNIPPSNDIWSVLDAVKLSDVVLYVMSTLEPISDVGKTLLRCSKEQGSPTRFLGVSDNFSKTEEKQFLKSIHKFCPVEKVYSIVNAGQVSNLLRMMSVSKISTPKQYDMRSGMLIESWDVLHLDESTLKEYLPNLIDENEPVTALLQVNGTIRKRNLNPHRPVHIPGHGTYQILRIDVKPVNDVKLMPQRDPGDLIQVPTIEAKITPRFMFDPKNQANDQDDAKMEDDMMSICTDDLEDMSEFGDGNNAQEDDEFSEDEKEIKKKKLPKGTSDYQADWLIDSDSDKEKEIVSDEEDLESLKDDEASVEVDDEDMDWEEEQMQLKLVKEARTEAEFPDWIDTPQQIPAKERFQRYRGLQSFKTSPWDLNENLPKEYSKIVQFQNFKHTYKSVVLKDAEDGPLFIPVGQRVTITLRPINTTTRIGPIVGQSPPISLFSLFPHESKISVLNLHLNLSEVIKNKEQLIFQVGFYRFQAQPILSEVSPGNKHKMLRYGQAASSCVATIFAPIIFPVTSVLVFKATESSLTHVGSGHLLSIDPTRLIIKRILLSGYPFRVHGRKTTVRFMFFNRQDIEWFKPVELKTRYGRRGHIKEPLGTHGHMKCVFDGPIKSQDTVLMPLYKRVFPKWNFDQFIPSYSLYESYNS